MEVNRGNSHNCISFFFLKIVVSSSVITFWDEVEGHHRLLVARILFFKRKQLTPKYYNKYDYI